MSEDKPHVSTIKKPVAERRIYEILRDLEVTSGLTVSALEMTKGTDYNDRPAIIGISIRLDSIR